MRDVLESYLSVVRRRWRLVVTLAAVFAALIFFALTARSGTYTSTAVVQVAANDTAAAVLGQSSGYQEPQQRLATELETFRSRAVAGRAAQRLRAEGFELTTDEVLRRVTASARGLSLFIEVQGTAATPERAQAITTAYVTAYSEYRRDLQRGELERLESDLRDRLAQAENELVLLEGQPDTAASGRQRGAAVQRYETATDLLERVRLRLSLDTSGVALASEPSLPGGDGSIVPPAVAAVLAVLAGLAAAVGAAMLVDLVRDPVRTRREAEQLTGIAPVGELPSPSAELPDVLVADRSPVAHAARGLRLRLDLAGPEGFPRPLVVRTAAAQAAEGTHAATALAGACAAAGMRTLLVAGQELVTALRAPAPGGEAVELPHGLRAAPASRPGVWLLSLASPGGGELGVADTPSPSTTLRDLTGSFDAVLLVDTGTELDDFDARGVRVAGGGELLVCVVGRTTSRWLTDAVDDVGSSDDLLASIVLVGQGRRRERQRVRRRAAPAEASSRDDVVPAAAGPTDPPTAVRESGTPAAPVAPGVAASAGGPAGPTDRPQLR